MYVSYFKKKFNNECEWKVTCIIISILIIMAIHAVYNSNMFYQHQRLKRINSVMMKSDIKKIEKIYPNLPLSFWIKANRQKKIIYRMNSTCAHLPNILELDIDNVWQTVKFSNATLQLFNAYYDPRDITTGINVRIPCLIDRTEIYFKSYCQLWFDDNHKPVITNIEDITYIWYKEWNMHVDKQYGPYLIECRVPESHKGQVPKAVSIVEHPCDTATNLLKVHYEHLENGEKKDFAVCIKGLDYLQVDLSARLAEWMEFQFLMGADKVFVYDFHMHPNMKKVIDYYIKLGKADLRLNTLPQGQNNLPILQHLYIKSHIDQQCLEELIPYNDCFYRNINLYKYIILLDIDEVIIPVLDNNWSDLIKRVLNHSKPGEEFASFSSRNVYFMDEMMPEGTYPDIPPYMHMLQHVYRSYNFTPPGDYVKTFFSTDHVLTCHNHYPIRTSSKVFASYDFETSESHMQHYRNGCPAELDCNIYRNQIVKDALMWKFKDVLIERTNKALEECGLLV